MLALDAHAAGQNKMAEHVRLQELVSLDHVCIMT